MSRRRNRHRASDLILDYAPPILGIVKAALELGPVPGLALVADGLSAIIERVQEARTNCEGEALFFSKVTELDAAIVEAVKNARAATGIGALAVVSRLDTLGSSLSELRKSAATLKGGTGVRGYVKGVFYAKRNEAILADMNEEMNTALAMFNLRGQVATEIAVHNVSNAVMNAEVQRIIHTIPHASAGYRCVDELKSGFMQGTREEIFQELEQWCGPGFPAGDPKPILFLSGAAGLGKSAIAHQLCKRISEEWRLNLGASFFFSRGRGNLESARFLFPTIAHDLALSQPDLRLAFVSAAQEYLVDGEEQQMSDAFQRLLWKPLVESPPSSQATTFVIIDGVDECKDRELVPTLLRHLLDLVRRLPWLRIFIASRPEPRIHSLLTSSAAADIVYHRNLNSTMDDGKADVELYFRKTVPNIPPYDKYIQERPEDLDCLIERAGGVFVYARVAVNFLETFDNHPEEQFKLLLEPGGTGISSMDGLYLHVLQSAFPPRDLRGSPGLQRRLRAFLTFLALRQEDLPLAAIALLLGLSGEDAIWMADRLRSVLLVDASGNIAPLHATFAEFLLDGARCIDPSYHVVARSGHAYLALRCLEAVTFDRTTEYLLGLQSGDTNGAYKRHVWYTGYWHRHLANAEYTTELAKQLQAFIEVQLPFAIRIHGRVMTAEANVARTFLEQQGQSEAIDALHCRYIKLGYYSEVWLLRHSTDERHAEHTDTKITSEDLNSYVRDAMLHWESFVASSSDVSQYETTLGELSRMIADSNTDGLWYDLKIGRDSRFRF